MFSSKLEFSEELWSGSFEGTISAYFFYFIIPSQLYMCLLTKDKLCLFISSIVLVKINTLRLSENPYKFRGRLKRSREVVKKKKIIIQIITILTDKLWFHSSGSGFTPHWAYLAFYCISISPPEWRFVGKKKTKHGISQPFPSNSHIWPSLTLNQSLYVFLC